VSELVGCGPGWADAIAGDRSGGAALMYSGGCDSTLAACRLAAEFPVVHLITYTRFGFLATDNPSVHFERMKARFPDVRFVLHRIPYGRMYEEVEGFRRLRSMWRYGSLTAAPCGHCKLSMHWRTLLFCVENGVAFAADGAVHGNEQFAEQNENILMPGLIEFYREHGLTLLHPVFERGLDTEEALFRLGITDSPQVKRTRADKQVICSQHILLAMQMRRFLHDRTFEEYEAAQREYLTMKLDHVRELTREHLRDAARSRLNALLEAPDAIADR